MFALFEPRAGSPCHNWGASRAQNVPPNWKKRMTHRYTPVPNRVAPMETPSTARSARRRVSGPRVEAATSKAINGETKSPPTQRRNLPARSSQVARTKSELPGGIVANRRTLGRSSGLGLDQSAVGSGRSAGKKAWQRTSTTTGKCSVGQGIFLPTPHCRLHTAYWSTCPLPTGFWPGSGCGTWSSAGMHNVHHSGASAAESHRLPLSQPITVATGLHAARGWGRR